MGFPKYAHAPIVKASINMDGWDEIRQKAVSLGPSFEARTANQVVLQQYNPDEFLLSHCSIIASVDTEIPRGSALGQQMVDGMQIDRKYADYYITPETTKYVNNNHDAWERNLLLSCFRTFIGGENYVEHIQIPELSKGKIIDAAARDIGDSIYVDILVATNRKHRPLIAAIEKGELSTLSMGAQVAFTICTKCGNVAEDELQLCRHIKYQKGNFFIDAMGKKRKIAELCGHRTSEPGSCRFIEGSWVANPAFTGAVLRNILDPRMAAESTEIRDRIQVAFSQPTRVADPSLLQKAAKMAPVGIGAKAVVADTLVEAFDNYPSLGVLSAPDTDSNTTAAEIHRQLRLRQIEAQGEEQQGGGGMGFQNPSQEDSKEEDPLSKQVKQVRDTIVDKANDQIQKELEEGEKSKTREVLDENHNNESLIKSAAQSPEWRARAKQLLKMAGNDVRMARTLFNGLVLFENGGWSAIAKSKKFTGSEILAISHVVDRITKKASMAGESRVYRTVMTVGGTSQYPNVDSYLDACRRVVGRDLTDSEKIQMVFKGQLYSLGR